MNKKQKVWQIWGLAAGVRTTKGAARGAFTIRDYPGDVFPREDWLEVIAKYENEIYLTE